MCENTYTTELNDAFVELRALHDEKQKIQSKIDELTPRAVALYERLTEDDKKTVRTVHDIKTVNNGDKKTVDGSLLSEKNQKKLASMLDPAIVVTKCYTVAQLLKLSQEYAEAVVTEAGHKKSVTFNPKRTVKK